MQYIFEKFAGQILVHAKEGSSMAGFYVVSGKVTCTKEGEVCFGNYLQPASQAEIDIVKNATLYEGTTEAVRKVVLAKMVVNMVSQKGASV